MFSPVGRRVLHKCLKILRLSFVEFSNLPDLKNLNIVSTVEKTINNNTLIFIESPIHVKVQPIDVNDIKAHDKLTMHLYSRGKSDSDFHVKQTAKRLELTSHKKAGDGSDVCVLQVPYHLKVQITTTDDASVVISKLEAEEFLVKTDKGAIEIADLKAKNIKLESNSGELETLGRIQASVIDLKTAKASSITCNNIMANTFFATTDAGTISLKSCYSDKSHFTTAIGNIKLNNIHSSVLVDVIQQGNLQVAGLNGNLQGSLKKGEVFIHAAELINKSSIFIHEKGKVHIEMPDIVKKLPSTNLIADKITVVDKILKLGRLMEDSFPKRFRYESESHSDLHVVCKNGSIIIKESDVPFYLQKN